MSTINKTCKLYVEGMHCSACEILIEKKLAKVENITFVDADLKDSTLEIEYKGQKPDISELNEYIKEHEYKITKKKPKTRRSRFISIQNGQIILNRDQSKTFILKSTLFVLLGFLFLTFLRSDMGSSLVLDESSSFSTFFVYGILAGGSTCAALVGGYLISLAKRWNEAYIDKNSIAVKFVPHILFHTGRIFSFTLVGVLLGILGTTIKDRVEGISLWITLFIGFLMIIVAFQMFEVEWAKKFQLRLPKSVGKFASNEEKFSGMFMPFVSGGLSFLIPCTVTISAFTAVLSADSARSAGINLLGFVLGTTVFLGAISIGVVLFNRTPQMTHHFNYIAGVLILFFGVFTVNSQLIKINAENGYNIPTIESVLSIFSSKSSGDVLSQGEFQVIEMEVDGIDFKPPYFEVEANKPVKFIIDGTKANGCTSDLIGKGIFPTQTKIIGKQIEVEFTLSKGTHNFSCWMGMARGQIRAV